MFPKIGPPKWMVKIMENPIKMDDLGVPLFSETSKYINFMGSVMGPVVVLRGRTRGFKKHQVALDQMGMWLSIAKAERGAVFPQGEGVEVPFVFLTIYTPED